MTRKSKIARLPRSTREELNDRLDNGQPAHRLVEWLNNLPEVQQILAREFQGRRITPQNLSEWRRGGYQDWLTHQEHQATLQDFLAHAKELGQDLDAGQLAKTISTIVTVHFAANLSESAYRPENEGNMDFWGRMIRDYARLHHAGIAQQRLELEEEKLAFQKELSHHRLEIDRARLDLARQRFELDGQERGVAVNLEEVPSSSPGLRRDAGRYPGKPSPEIVPNPQWVAPRTAQGSAANEVNTSSVLTPNSEQPPSSLPSETPINAPKIPLEINALQPNPTKSNNHFFIFPQTTTVGQASCLSSSSGILGAGLMQKPGGFSTSVQKALPLPKGLEPLGKRRKESGRSQRPARAERAGASESLGRGEGEVGFSSFEVQGNEIPCSIA